MMRVQVRSLVSEYRSKLRWAQPLERSATHDDPSPATGEAEGCRSRMLEDHGAGEAVTLNADEIEQDSLTGPSSRNPDCSNHEAAEQQRDHDQTSGHSE
jgi:hypothetical protein